jgi:hypothetical protein
MMLLLTLRSGEVGQKEEPGLYVGLSAGGLCAEERAVLRLPSSDSFILTLFLLCLMESILLHNTEKRALQATRLTLRDGSTPNRGRLAF